jgi:hypothetical protein
MAGNSDLSGFEGYKVTRENYFSFGETDSFAETHSDVQHTFMGKVEPRQGEDQPAANFSAYLQLRHLINSAFEEMQ